MLGTSRPYDLEAYQRTNHGIGLAYRHAPLTGDYIEHDYGVKRDLCVPEAEPKVATTQRKRVPVACERCRKRKIKCSGDQGDGQGCDNCKTAGWDGCQFLRVRSELLQCHPTVSSNRTWHNAHYHPYSRYHRGMHHLQTSPNFISSNNVSHPSWHNEVDYSGLSANSNSVSWPPQNYISQFSMYDTEDVSTYTAQTPSYMLPDPDHTFNTGTNSVTSFSRAQQGGLWPSQINTAPNGHFVRPGYAMETGPLAKPYTLIPLSTSFNTDRNVINASLHSSISAVPSNVDERSPTSAASQQSSHTWNTETTSSTGNLSSQTSCGDVQDISGLHRHATSEDQSTLYPYVTHRGSPQINVAAAALPTVRETLEPQSLLSLSDALRSAPDMAFSDAETVDLNSAHSRESFRTTSPSLYGYASRSRNLYYEVMPKRTTSDNIPYRWHGTSTSPSRQNDLLLGEQHQQNQHSSDLSDYPVTGGAVTSLIPSSTY